MLVRDARLGCRVGDRDCGAHFGEEDAGRLLERAER